MLFAVSALVATIVVFVTKREQWLEDEKTLQGRVKEMEGSITKLEVECTKLTDCANTWQGVAQSLEKSVAIMQDVLKTEFGKTIIDYSALKEIEGSVKEGGEIWVLTSALELENTELKETIRANFRKNIIYKYLIPNDSLLQNRMKKLAHDWQKDCGLSNEQAERQIKCYVVPKHFAYMTVIIYDPYSTQPTICVKFPTSRIYEAKKYPYIYKVDTEPKAAWEAFIQSLQELIDDSRSCQQTKPLPLGFY